MVESKIPSQPILEAFAPAWGSRLQPTGCRVCGQAFLVTVAAFGQACPNCAQGHLEPQPARLRPEPPERLVRFRINRNNLRPVLDGFTKSIWLRPDDFNTETLLKRIQPLFWPMWLVDSDVTGQWCGEAGFDYQVKSSMETYQGGGWQTNETLETRIRWEPRAGTLQRHYANLAIPSVFNHRQITSLVNDYRHDESVPFNHDLLAKGELDRGPEVMVRVPELPPESAWPMAKNAIYEAALLECRKAAGGQHMRNYSLEADYDSLNWTQLLLPLYTSYYTDDDGKQHPVWINGQTGAIGGLRLASQRKGWKWAGLLALAALLLFLFSLAGFALSVAMPFLGALAGFTVFLAFVAGIAAIIPAVWPWQWNRRQQEQKIHSQ